MSTVESTVESKLVSPPEVREWPYSVFSRREKWFIVSLVSLAGMFSPFTANIYLPAIPTLVSAFHESTEMINLTVTMYMILQGLSPMIFGSLADYHGRRPVFIICLCVLCVSCVGLALVPTNTYWLLMLLRCVQATGSASTIALGAGVIGDIAVPAERGGFFGIYSLGPMLGPALGPVIGGALAQWSWRSIFWFLCIATGLTGTVIILFLPETLRQMVGDGSIVPTRLHRPLIPIIGPRQSSKIPSDYPIPPKQKYKNPLLLFKNLDIVMLLVFNGIVYSVFYTVTASISTLFVDIYPFLNDITIGLCYLAIGVGTIAGSVGTGKLLDWDFQRMKKIYTSPPDFNKYETGELVNDFPVEKARLRLVPLFMAMMVVAGMGYGWCLEKKVNIAVPLIFQFIIGALSISVANPTQTLILDLMPGQGSSVSACSNIIRCSMGAVAVSVIDLILNRLGPGFAYVLLNGIIIIFIPLLFLVMKLGPIYRRGRDAVLHP